jgi:branched-chain amino acid transport system permease protein
MDLPIFALLTQDGVTNGAVYALLALALVLVFTVTRVIFVPSGRAGGLRNAHARRAAARQAAGDDRAPGRHGGAGRRHGDRRLHRQKGDAPDPASAGVVDGVPLALAGIAAWLATPELPFWAQILVTLALVTPLGPLLYRVAYQPLAEASVLVLLIVSVAVHFALTGLGLWFFGAEGSRTPPFAAASFDLSGVNVSLQSLLVVLTSLALIVAFYFFFGRTLYGKALARRRSTASARGWWESRRISPGR